MMKTLLTLCCIASLSACVASNPVEPEVEPQPAGIMVKSTNSEQSLALQALQQAQEQWATRAANHYIYTLHYTPAFNKPVRIRVQNGEVIQAMTVPDNSPLPAKRSASILTVNDLFAAAETEMHGNDKIKVVYDHEYGYPEFITTGGKDGGKYKASGMRLLK